MLTQTEDFRQQPPAPLPPRALNLPSSEETTLENGLRVVVVEQERLPLVSFRLAFRTGDAFDPPELPGLTDTLTSMLVEGTESRTSRQIAEEVARLGATLSAGATSDFTTVAASSLAAFTDEVLELLADVALRPSFPENELALARANAQQNLIAQRAQSSFLAAEAVARVIFGGHPYAVVSPTPESIEATAREHLLAEHRSKFVPGNAVLFAVGDLSRAQTLARITELFGDWQPGEVSEPNFPAPPARTRRATYLVSRPGSAQTNIVVANPCIKRTDPDYFPFLVMHTILGGTASARLFMNLREEKGYTYGAYTQLDARRYAGSFRATTEVRNAVIGASLKEIFYELGRIRSEDVSDKELTDAKTYLTGTFPIRLETQEGLVDQLVQIRMNGLAPDYLQTYCEHIQRVTKDDVRRVAVEHVTPDRAAIVVVGDAADIREQVAPFAETLEVFDGTAQSNAGALIV
ncbi:MAG TPA: pitrilysin family protein [Pyrinomonadaceae bacterium]|jgi:zinc protease|nr:pitrilysin family protein [Pyrinomonadaceae bacterium]